MLDWLQRSPPFEAYTGTILNQNVDNSGHIHADSRFPKCRQLSGNIVDSSIYAGTFNSRPIRTIETLPCAMDIVNTSPPLLTTDTSSSIRQGTKRELPEAHDQPIESHKRNRIKMGSFPMDEAVFASDEDDAMLDDDSTTTTSTTTIENHDATDIQDHDLSMSPGPTQQTPIFIWESPAPWNYSLSSEQEMQRDIQQDAERRRAAKVVPWICPISIHYDEDGSVTQWWSDKKRPNRPGYNEHGWPEFCRWFDDTWEGKEAEREWNRTGEWEDTPEVSTRWQGW
ncbi:hypothetical protein BJ508DRAFT_315394 [Ascobolus immersus RN42]|uniref:Uncharacterized protein n=1 Tax=Ascobolus immersus RN42 TaxID=1160509 RepID=A0A3N4HB27_ASCIM|nr:hypothetical protein BJ508DRAFT_315394 [Ascobolus immersus RN42]